LRRLGPVDAWETLVIRWVADGWRGFWGLPWRWRGSALGGVTATLLLVGVLVGSGAFDDEPATSDNVDSAVRGSATEPTQATADISDAAALATYSATEAEQATAEVVGVIDGETIEVSIRGETFTVRYIGIATPGTVDPGAADCFDTEAAARNEELVAGKRVELETDVTDSDSHGRLLRYVYLDGEMVNAMLVGEGYVVAFPTPPDVAHASELAELEGEARDAGRGLWSACAE
jgi:micrococcal nuclease